LLLTGEYFVLDGALALAVPVRYGQSLTIKTAKRASRFKWQSYNHLGEIWFESTFSPEGKLLQANEQEAGERLAALFRAIEQEQPGFFYQQQPELITTHLDFPRKWGLGTSSTLVAALSLWSDTNPFYLLGHSFGGSGYDIACATAKSPLFFQKRNGTPNWVGLNYCPPFAEHLYFVYLGEKQNSREGIKRYRAFDKTSDSAIKAISELSLQFIQASSLKALQSIMKQHEQIVSDVIQMTPVQEQRFSDFSGQIKSLGAWGGDFVMAATELDDVAVKAYFEARGLSTCFSWEELVWNTI
jgi:mevalonate kinase